MAERMIVRGLAVALVLGMSMAASAWGQDKPAAPAAGATQDGAPTTDGNSGKGQKAGKEEKARSPKQIDRVFPRDLEGTWIAASYRDKLARTRSPRAAASANVATAIKIQRDNRTYPMLITNFQRAVLVALIDVQPDRKPQSYRLAVAKEDSGVVYASDLSYIYFRGERGKEGIFKSLSIAEPHFSKRKSVTYTRLDGDLEAYVNRTVIAGKYTDAQGRAYEFSETGEAVLPDRKFIYEVNLDASAARCDMLVSHGEREADGKERIGFAWKGETLQLFQVTGSKAPLTCAGTPFALLERS